VTAELERIAQTTREMPGDAVAPIVDMGVDEATGAMFLVTDYVVVPSLAHMVELCPLTQDEMFLMLNAVGAALERGQMHGLTHGALKPANIFIAATPGSRARLADYGASVVRAVLASPLEDPRALPWLAPEQARGGAASGARTDVFSAALVAFFAATGRSYWRASQASGLDVPRWELEISGARASFVERAKEHGVTLPAAVDAPFARALAVDASRRYESVAALARAIADAIAGRAVAAVETADVEPPPPPPPPLAAAPVIAAPPPIAANPAIAAPPPVVAAPPPPVAPPTPAPAPPAFAPLAPVLTPRAEPTPFAAPNSPAPLAMPVAAAEGHVEWKPRPKKPVVLIGIAISLFVAAFAIVVLALVTGHRGERAVASASATASSPAAPATSVAVAPSTASAAPTLTAPVASAPVASAPAASATAEPIASAQPSASASATDDTSLTIACAPACDSFRIDGSAVDVTADPIPLAAGAHDLLVSKAGYVAQGRKVVLKKGQKQKLTFLLLPVGAQAPAQPKPPAQPPSQPCGKFLKRCN
jgi:hypothetical protein